MAELVIAKAPPSRRRLNGDEMVGDGGVIVVAGMSVSLVFSGTYRFFAGLAEFFLENRKFLLNEACQIRIVY